MLIALYKGFIMYLIGVAVFLFGVAATNFFKGVPFAAYVNPAVVFVVLMSIIGVLVATSGFKTFISGLNAVISKKYYISDCDRGKAINLFRLLSKTVLYASLIAFLVGIIAALSYMDNLEMVGHAFASAMIGLLYGPIISIAFFETAAYILKNRTEEVGSAQAYSKQMGDRLLELCRQNGIPEEDILSATEIELRK